MKSFWKTMEKVSILLIVTLLLSTVFLPIVASAQENISSSDIEEVISEDTITLEEEDVDSLEFLFSEQLSSQDVSNQEDLDFLNNITAKITNGELFLTHDGIESDYTITVETQESDFELITDESEKEQIKFYNLNENSEITINIQNNKTTSENVVTISMNSEKLTTINQDLLVDINPETDPEAETDPETDPEAEAEAETETETEKETETETETETDLEAETDPKTEISTDSSMSRIMLAKIYDEFLTKKNVNYYAIVLTSNDGIYTKPNGMEGAILYTSYKYNNKDVKIGEEATTASGTFVKLLRITDNGTVGWIKKSGISVKTFDTFLTKKNVTYYATVLAKNDGIYTKPKGMVGAILYTSYKYNNKDVKVGEEATTANGTFVKLIRISDNGTIGWIKKSSISVKTFDTFLTKKNVTYNATVLTKNDGIYTKPKGMVGAVLYTNYKYNNKDVKVGEEATTASGTFVKLIRTSDNGTIGWTKKSSVSILDRIISQTTTSYRAKIKLTNDGIYTQPKGMYGSILYTNYLYNNKTVQVIQEATTESGVFAKIARIEDGIVLGWINKKSLNTEKIVFLDAGHGGTDGGATYYGVNEKSLNLKVAMKVKANLEALGFTVVMMRETDKTFGLLERSMAANLSGADIFVSIHHNAMPGSTTAAGIETYYYQYDPDYPSKMNQLYHNNPARILESANLAADIHSSLISSTGAINRGIKRNTFSVLRETAIPAVLLELGYMTSPAELAKLNTNSYQNTLAKAITNGIATYFK